MNLTEYQMDRLADAFSSHQPRATEHQDRATNNKEDTRASLLDSLTRRGRSNDGTGKNQTQLPVSHYRSGNDLAAFGTEDDPFHDSEITTQGNTKRTSNPSIDPGLMPRSTLAERRKQADPGRIEVVNAGTRSTYVQPSETFPTDAHPLTPNRPLFSRDDSRSSVYSQLGIVYSPQVSPLRSSRSAVSQQLQEVMQTYSDWKDTSSSRLGNPGIDDTCRTSLSRRMSPIRDTSPVRCGSRGRRLIPDVWSNPQTNKRVEVLRQPESDNGSYSPLVTYFAFEGLPVQRIGGKTLIGEQGWLDRPDAVEKKVTPEHRKEQRSPKKPGLLDSIKKMAKDMTENKNSRRPRESDCNPQIPRMTISLDPREQSLLYCELEFHVGNAIHAYVTNELNHGRLDADKLKKIADGWSQKGRPKVVGFRYDLETQLELIYLHLDKFRFFGRRQGNLLEVAGLLHAMKVNARSMRIRTFCQPDTVIAKQLVDSQSLFNTLGCSEAQQISLAEIAQFFKVIVERERHYRKRLNRDVNAPKVQNPDGHPGCRWDPPHENDDSGEIFGSASPNKKDFEANRRPRLFLD